MSSQSVNVGATVAASPTIAATERVPGRPADPSTAGESPLSATISPWSKLLNRLEGLQTLAPESFKAAATQLETRVDVARNHATGDQRTSLEKLGSALAHAAKTGDTSAVRPALHHHHVHIAKHTNGGTGALLSNLLEEIGAVLDHDAPPTIGS